jgi:hypothetical protein
MSALPCQSALESCFMLGFVKGIIPAKSREHGGYDPGVAAGRPIWESAFSELEPSVGGTCALGRFNCSTGPIQLSRIVIILWIMLADLDYLGCGVCSSKKKRTGARVGSKSCAQNCSVRSRQRGPSGWPLRLGYAEAKSCEGCAQLWQLGLLEKKALARG